MRSRRQVRVLFINDTARNGGPGRSLHSILSFLDPEVVHRRVVLPRAGPISELVARGSVADEICFEPGLVENPVEPWSRPMQRHDHQTPLGLRALRFAGNVARTATAMGRLARMVRRDRFDLIYCNGTNADFGGGALAALTDVPALWHVRYTAIPSVARPVHRRMSASSGVRRIICVSRAAARLFDHCATKVAVIHNALDVEGFDPARVRGALRADLRLPPEAIVFGSHGRVLRRKGYIEMIEAARLALGAMDARERARVFFVVVGDTPEDFADDHLADCRRVAQEAGIGDRFKMLGFRSDVRSLVADFDVAVVPSVYPDPLPRSVMESMALGKPVIAFDVGGIAEMLAGGVTGELVAFEPRERGSGASRAAVERLALAFLRYARDPDRRARQGAEARAHALRAFDARAHALAIQGEIVAAAGLAIR